MIEQCPIILIEQHTIYYTVVNAELSKDITDLQSSEFLLDSAMSHTELKIIVAKIPAET